MPPQGSGNFVSTTCYSLLGRPFHLQLKGRNTSVRFPTARNSGPRTLQSCNQYVKGLRPSSWNLEKPRLADAGLSSGECAEWLTSIGREEHG